MNIKTTPTPATLVINVFKSPVSNLLYNTFLETE